MNAYLMPYIDSIHQNRVPFNAKNKIYKFCKCFSIKANYIEQNITKLLLKYRIFYSNSLIKRNELLVTDNESLSINTLVKIIHILKQRLLEYCITFEEYITNDIKSK